MKWSDFLHVDTNSHKLKDPKIFGLAWLENGMVSLVTEL